MFGYGAFGELPFGALPDDVGVGVVGLLHEQPASMSGHVEAGAVYASGMFQEQSSEIVAFVDALVRAVGLLQELPAQIMGSAPALIVASGAMHEQPAAMSGLARRLVTPEVRWTCDTELEFVSTTNWIDMVERGNALLGTAAEIRVRSL